jgi:hypothetical protein
VRIMQLMSNLDKMQLHQLTRHHRTPYRKEATTTYIELYMAIYGCYVL